MAGKKGVSKKVVSDPDVKSGIADDQESEGGDAVHAPAVSAEMVESDYASHPKFDKFKNTKVRGE